MLIDELSLNYINTYNLIKEELKENIKSQRSFSITLDA